MGSSTLVRCGRDDPSSESLDFVAGPITVKDRDGTVFTLDDRSGIEALALAHFRSDFRTMLEQGQGLVLFGDHDFSQIAKLEIVRPEAARVTSNLASLDLFDIAVGELPLHRYGTLLSRSTTSNLRLGPLTGYCHGCGAPSSSYFAKPLVIET